MLQSMATLAQKRAAEADMRALLEDHGLPQPDEVEYGYTCIRLIWLEPKVAVVIDIDPPPPGWAVAPGDTAGAPGDTA